MRARLSPSPGSRRGNPRSHLPKDAALCGASIPVWRFVSSSMARPTRCSLRFLATGFRISSRYYMDCQPPFARLLPRSGQGASSGEALRLRLAPRSETNHENQSVVFEISPEEALPYGHQDTDGLRSQSGLGDPSRSARYREFCSLFQRNMVPVTAARR